MSPGRASADAALQSSLASTGVYGLGEVPTSTAYRRCLSVDVTELRVDGLGVRRDVVAAPR